MNDFAQSTALLVECAWKLASYCAWPLGMVALLVGVLYLFYEIEKRRRA